MPAFRTRRSAVRLRQTGLSMRVWSMLTAAALLPGCTSLNPPPPVARPEPIQAREAPPAEVALPAPAPPPAAPQPKALRIDNTSIESFRATWQRLNAGLSPAKKAALDNAVARLAFARYPGGADLPRNLRNSPIVPETVRDRLHGLSYDEIVALSR
jgi:hypothetical protein